MFIFTLLFSLITFAQVEVDLDLIGQRKLVALGESGHAVAEFHNARAMLSKRLIEKQGFRNILVEEDILSGWVISDAIDTCRDPGADMDLVKKAFQYFDPSTYRHQEFYAFYEYLCKWNKDHPKDPVRLSGIDIWSNYWDLRKYFEAKFPSLAIPELSKSLVEAKDQCFLWSIENLNEYPTHPDWVYYEKYQRIEPTRHANCLAALYALETNEKKNKNTIVQKLGEAGYYRILMATETARTQQFVRDVYTFQFAEAMKYRDANQARNVQNHLKMYNTTTPTIFMAHNVHIFTKMSEILPREITTPRPWANVPSAGEWLKAYYGEEMAVIAIGGYNLKSLRDGQYPLPTSPRSLDLKLHNQGYKTVLIEAPAGQWWVHNESETQGLWIKPQDQFDYYYFIDESGPATKFNPLLVTGETEQSQVLY